MIKKELAGYSRVPGLSDQKTDFGRFGEHPRYTEDTPRKPNLVTRLRKVSDLIFMVGIHQVMTGSINHRTFDRKGPGYGLYKLYNINLL